jgi:hypothetical protein
VHNLQDDFTVPQSCGADDEGNAHRLRQGYECSISLLFQTSVLRTVESGFTDGSALVNTALKLIDIDI